MILLAPTTASAQQSLEGLPVHAQVRKQSFWHDRDVFFFAGVQTAAQIADGITTIQGQRRGQHEGDPISRALLGRYPKWDRMAPFGAVQIIGTAYVAHRMHQCHNAFLRRFWWLPHSVSISLSTSMSVRWAASSPLGISMFARRILPPPALELPFWVQYTPPPASRRVIP